ncbi:MAG: undecaprenyl-diphosphate phosphatase [Thermaerobacter sp.]|nr:undecaprenyl-diphosphate phosphatase [Thermaerobacter sp.]
MSHPYLVPALIAGLIQGIVEWLPVSSKTMITLYFTVLGIKVQNAYSLGLIANFGSFFAALYYFRREAALTFLALAHPFASDPYSKLLRFLVIGTLATGVIGIPIYVSVRHTFTLVGGSVAMLAIGVLLLFTGALMRRKEHMMETALAADSGDRQPTTGAAILTGAMQGLAALPGISRSGMTITPLLWMGFTGEEAIRLSFMLDVLALVGAGVVPLVIGQGGQAAVSQFGLGTTILMVAVAAVVSFLAINAVLNVAKRLKTSTVTFGIAAITLVIAGLAVGGL